MIVPKTHHKNHSSIQRLTQGFESTLLLENVLITEGSLLSIAKLVRDGVEFFESGKCGIRVLENFSVLNEDAFDLHEVTRVRSCVGVRV